MSQDPSKLGPGEQWDATKGAVAEAAKTGTDIGPIEGTGPGGTVTKADVQAAAGSGSGVKTPLQNKVAQDATARKADKDQADAQVKEDQAVFDAAKKTAAQAHAIRVKADAAAYDALQKATDVSEPPAADPTDEKAVANRNKIVADNQAIVAKAVILQSAATQAAKDEDAANAALVAAKDKLVASQKRADSLSGVTEKSPWYYCLEHGHFGDLYHNGRFFQSDEPGCPTCPQCKRQVSAASVPGFGVFPPGVVAVQERLTGGKV